MRPSLLDPLFAPVTTLPGVGPKNEKLFARLFGGEHGARVVDLLFHLPSGGIDRRNRPKIKDAPRDEIVTLEVRVAEHRPPSGRNSRAPYRIVGEDETGDVELVFFNAYSTFIEKKMPVGSRRWASGRLELWDGHLQIVQPLVLDEAELARLPPVEPVYPLTEGLSGRLLGKAAGAALERAKPLPEWIDKALLTERGWPDWREALAALHTPRSPAALAPESGARARLAYDEMLAGQLALALVRASLVRPQGRSNAGDGRLSAAILAALPYQLTGAQSRAVEDIRADLASQTQMLRLLQGDVGSGKTVVALLAMASAVEAGRQAALMAPTEILARQHFARLQPLAEPAGLRLALMTGRDRASERRATLAALAAGEIDMIVGTHALFQEEVSFRDLGLAVVDEQHRFGVHQRLALSAKGEAVDVLVMTATPIPRTLALSYFGDMDVSDLKEKPPGRKPIDTRVVSLERLDEMVEGVGRALAAGRQAYWICPLVSDSETSDLAAAEDRHDDLARIFGADRVGLVHGKMKGPAKDAAMADFQEGRTRLLVATTVVEVGVDVPDASIMIIEHAERFGLAQLHQLRGRVGRGAEASTCILLYRGPLSESGQARLNIMRETEDGFRIAEEDLRLRGEGEVLGSRQSGMPGFKLADPAIHGPLLEIARKDARVALQRDPGLESDRGRALRILLHLFERDAAARLLRAG